MKAIMSNCRDPENRSRKLCVCGGHSMDAKSNKNHNATRVRLSVRKSRKNNMKATLDGYPLLTQEDWDRATKALDDAPTVSEEEEIPWDIDGMVSDFPELIVLVRQRGKDDALDGHPPSEVTGPYHEGYEEGMHMRRDWDSIDG